MTRIAVLQMTSGIDPEKNAETLVNAMREACSGGAEMLFTPEMSGLLDRDRARGKLNIKAESEDAVLAGVMAEAKRLGLWVSLGSLAVEREDGRWANRAFVIDAAGQVAARYDKLHMFDVDLAGGGSWRESAAYVAGDTVSCLATPAGNLGLAICYDLRFPALFEELGRQQCDIIAIPAAFTVPTGQAHWHVLQRARAIEASCYVVAAAQVGQHEDGRNTYGHSLVIDPWGDIMLDLGGENSGLGFADIAPSRIAEVRKQLPSLANRRKISSQPSHDSI